MKRSEVLFKSLRYAERMQKCVERRKAIGVTQREVATDLGVSIAMISYIETLRKKSFAYLEYYESKFGGEVV